MSLDSIILIGGIVIQLIYFWLYYKITKRFFYKYWLIPFLMIHFTLYYFILKKPGEIIMMTYIVLPLAYSLIIGITKILTTNFSVNLFQWHISRNEKITTENEENIDLYRKQTHQVLGIILIGIIVFFIVFFFRSKH